MPERVAFQMTVPPLTCACDEATYGARLTEAVEGRELAIAAETRQLGKPILGRRAILRQSFSDGPSTGAPRRRLNPRLAAQNGRVMAGAKRELKAFYAPPEGES